MQETLESAKASLAGSEDLNIYIFYLRYLVFIKHKQAFAVRCCCGLYFCSAFLKPMAALQSSNEKLIDSKHKVQFTDQNLLREQIKFTVLNWCLPSFCEQQHSYQQR